MMMRSPLLMRKSMGDEKGMYIKRATAGRCNALTAVQRCVTTDSG